ncbi:MULTISPECIES: porin [unclassified Mesorhizobium]|uniref:porin n=1 Tax=unclassified Mesorhizobium TaxID=325217 RepID=UPI001CD023DA|nr:MULTISPECIES: porin [unclassified Mesorhizobium]MBZ9739783.1 porin [Mesorhizobium sp. CO1-1-4]MBZ9804953.1 porin [Mesorhizobium sp. ES1-6]
MKMKSLLFGSAAAVAVASGARAADAPVAAEAEPAEYVRVCEVYGAGYLYIPGTETCLRIGGYVRYDVGAGDVGSFDGARTHDVQDGGAQATWYKNTRFTLKTWTGQETELGTLKTYTETRINFGDRNAYSGPDSPQNYASNKGLTLNFAWVQLGGLRVGKDYSAFDTFIGYAGNVINDTLVPYGDFNTNVVQYYFDVGQGLSAVVSLEQGQGKVGTIDSYVPHVVGGVKYKQGWGAITGVVAYDSNYAEVAGKVRIDFNVTKDLSLFGMFGYGSDGNLNDDTTNAIPAHGRGFHKVWGGNWGFWAGGTYKFNRKTSFNLQVSGDQLKNYGVAANISYEAVPGFTVTAEVDYVHYGDFGVATTKPSNVNFTNADKKNNVGGILRFQRSF